MWRLTWVVMLAAPVARADDATTLRAKATAEAPREVDPTSPTWAHVDPHPWSHVDPLPRTDLEPFDALEGHTAVRHALGAHTWITLHGDAWTQRDATSPSHGWGAGLTLSRDLGFAQLDLGAVYQQRDGRGPLDGRNARYTDLTAAVTLSKRMSRWHTVWISLGVGQRIWHGRPPPGEHGATQALLTIGTTFR